MTKTARKVLDVLALITLFYFATQSVGYSLLVGPGYLGATVGLLLHAFAVGAIIYILSSYRQVGKNLSAVFLVLMWLFGLLIVVFGYAPGEFSEPGILVLKLIMFFYPIFYFIFLLRRISVFKVVALFFVVGSLGQFLTLLVGTIVSRPEHVSFEGMVPVLVLAIIVTLVATLFPSLYTLYRLLRVDRLERA